MVLHDPNRKILLKLKQKPYPDPTHLNLYRYELEIFKPQCEQTRNQIKLIYNLISYGKLVLKLYF